MSTLDPFLGDKAAFDTLRALADPKFGKFAFDTKFGPLVPNVDHWLPGDLVLVQGLSKKDIKRSAAIQQYQFVLARKDYAQHDVSARKAASLWTHVAVFDGNDIWEAMPNRNVNVRSVRDYLKDNIRIRVQRWTGATVHPDRLLRALNGLIGRRYRMRDWSVGPALASRLLTKPRDKALIKSDSLICSVFAQMALTHATSTLPLRKYAVPVPLDFALNEEFSTIESHWCRFDHMGDAA